MTLTVQREREVVRTVHHPHVAERPARVDAVVLRRQVRHLQPLAAEADALVAEQPQPVVEPLEAQLRGPLGLAAQHHLAARGQVGGGVRRLEHHAGLVADPCVERKKVRVLVWSCGIAAVLQHHLHN